MLLDDECALEDHYVMSIAASLREDANVSLKQELSSVSGAPEERLTRAPREKPLAVSGDSAKRPLNASTCVYISYYIGYMHYI